MPRNGGPAFPKPAFYAPGTVEDGLYNGPEDGMSLRDYFAASVVQAIIAFEDRALSQDDALPVEAVARQAYELADAMLAARERNGDAV